MTKRQTAELMARVAQAEPLNLNTSIQCVAFAGYILGRKRGPGMLQTERTPKGIEVRKVGILEGSPVQHRLLVYKHWRGYWTIQILKP
jgi:hypothetical protein